MKRLALIIDGNHFMHTTLTAVGAFSSKSKIFEVGSSDEETRKDTNALLDRLSTIFASDVRNFGSLIDEIVFTVDDSRSWRKDIILDTNYIDLPTDLDYKGNRKKDKTINWSLIYTVFNNFLENLQKHSSVKVVSIKGCEGDDLISVFSSYYNSMGKSVILYSGDNDLKQCVKYNKSNNSFTLQYQKQTKKVLLTVETGRYLKTLTDNFIVDYLKSFCNNASSKLTVINPIEVILEKVVLGDDGDNIKSIISESRTYKTGKNTTYEKRITPSILEKVKGRLDMSSLGLDDFYNDYFINNLANLCIQKFEPLEKKNIDGVINNINLNVRLVILDYRSVPTSLYDEMLNWVEKNYLDKKVFDTKKITNNKNILSFMPMYDKTLAESASSASIFKHLGL